MYIRMLVEVLSQNLSNLSMNTTSTNISVYILPTNIRQEASQLKSTILPNILLFFETLFLLPVIPIPNHTLIYLGSVKQSLIPVIEGLLPREPKYI